MVCSRGGRSARLLPSCPLELALSSVPWGDVGCRMRDVGCKMWDVGCRRKLLEGGHRLGAAGWGGCRMGLQEGVQAGPVKARPPACSAVFAHGQQRRILSFRRGAILSPTRSRIQTKGITGRGERRIRLWGWFHQTVSLLQLDTDTLCALSRGNKIAGSCS